MKTIHLFVGLPGSGKTTFYRKNKALFFKGAIRLSLDDFRRLIGGHQFHKPFEPIVRMWVDVTADYLAESGHDLVVDATNLSLHLRQKWLGFAKKNGYVVKCWYFTTDSFECMKRDLMRADEGTMVGRKIIEGMDGKFDKPIKGEGYADLIRVDGSGRVKKSRARKK